MNLKEFRTLLEEKEYGEIKSIYKEMNEFDISVLIGDLPINFLKQAFRLLPKDIASDVFANFDIDLQQDLIVALTTKEATDIVEDMYSDDAADLFEEMSAGVVQKILSRVDKSVRDDINTLLKYPKNSAGSLMTVEYIHLKKGLSIKQSIERIRKQADEIVSFDNCFVTDNKRRLLGTVSVKDLLINNPYELIDDIMEECEHPINTLMDQEDVVKVFQDYDYNVLPVVDSEGLLVGIITIDDVMDIMEQEASEDMEMIAGVIPTETEVPYLKKSIWEMYKSRMPWLLFLMISSIFTGQIISNYESALETYVILTSFIPMIMGTGGNAGSQSSVTVIRALSLEEIEFKDLLRVIWKEIRISFICGITLAFCNFLKLIYFDQIAFNVSLVVSVTLILTILLAKAIGSILPILAEKLKLDPAVMASPLITTIVDAGSLMIYFKIACFLLNI